MASQYFKIDSELTLRSIRRQKSIIEGPCRINNMTRFEVGRFGAFSFCRGGDFSGVISIGRYCSIAWDVAIGPEEHRISMLTTSTFLNSKWEMEGLSDYYKRNGIERKAFLDAIRSTKARNTKTVSIGNDVWIGKGSIIRRGVTVGDGAVIGANSVVSADVEPYTIVSGNPSIPLRKRFDEATVDNLVKARWWDMSLQSLDGIDWTDPKSSSKELFNRRSSGNYEEAIYPIL